MEPCPLQPRPWLCSTARTWVGRLCTCVGTGARDRSEARALEKDELERLCLVADPFLRTGRLRLNIQDCGVTPAKTIRCVRPAPSRKPSSM